jgi:hypothetical protein
LSHTDDYFAGVTTVVSETAAALPVSNPSDKNGTDLPPQIKRERSTSITSVSERDADFPAKRKPPMLVTGSMIDSGLGCLEWWSGDE